MLGNSIQATVSVSDEDKEDNDCLTDCPLQTVFCLWFRIIVITSPHREKSKIGNNYKEGSSDLLY